MAYLNQGGDAVERQLIDIFVDGITNDSLKIKKIKGSAKYVAGGYCNCH